MITKVEELLEGDEILIPSGSKLIYARVLRRPHLRFRKDVTGNKVPVLNYYTKVQEYSNVACSVNLVETERKNQYSTWKEKRYLITPEDHNSERYFNLNRCSIWRLGNNTAAVTKYIQYKKSLKEEQ